MKKLKRILSMLLVVCMIFTSQAFVTFAEGMENTEAIVKETTIEETAVKETEETIIGENSEDSANNEFISPDVDEKEESIETEYAEEPEEDEIETETRMGELSEPEDFVGAKLGELEEIEANTEDKLLGATKYLSYIMISQYTTKTYHVGDTYDPSDLKIKAYYDNTDTGDEEMVEVAYTDDTSKFSFSPDCVNNPFTASTTEENQYELTITYTDDVGDYASATTAFQVYPATAPTQTAYVYYMKYNDTTKKYEDKYATIESGKTDEELNTFIDGLWDTTFENRLVSWFVMSPTDPSKEDLASYDHFSNKFDYDGTKEHFKVAYNNWNNGTPTENLHLGAGFSKCNFNLFYRVKYGSYDPEKTWGFGPEGQTDEQFEEFFKPIIDETMIKDGVKGLYKLNPANPMNPTLDDYNEYYTGASVYEATLTGLKQAYDAWNDNPTEGISFGVIYTDPSAPTTYTVTYNQNLPSGYTLSDGKPWYDDATTDDLSGYPIELEGNADMTCEDTSGNVRTLEGWNTAAGGAGTPFEFGDIINVATEFTGDTLTLYAVWSEPVGPAPTADWYWYLEGDTIIHYTNTYETGRTPVEYDTDGAVVYNGLSDSLKHNNIETAVFDNKIVAPKAQSFFKEFLRLKTITNIDNLDTSSATSFKNMFSSCGSLETLDVSSLNTSNATDMESMFQWCNTLTSLNVSNLDTSKVTNMVSMFNSCKKIEELDLTSFKTSNVKSMAAMFTNCEELTTIKTTVDFVVDQVTDLTLNNLFEGNTKLVGGKGTTYDASKLKKEYARIDEGPTKPGYFTGTIPPTPTTYTVTYNQNLPSGYTISASKTWYTDSTSDDLSSNPIKISGSAGMTCENADGYVRKLETWNTLADKSGTPYMFAENISSPAAFTSNPLTLYAIWSDPVAPSTATDIFYIISYGNPTEYPNEKKIFAFDSTTTVAEMENFVANNISKCINPSGKAANGFYDMSELIPAGADDTQVRQILNNHYDLTKEKIRTLDKISVIFEDYLPDPMGVYLGITFEGSTPTPPTPSPTPRPYVPGGGDSSGSSSGSSDPTHGPMGDLTKNPLYADTLNGTNNIPESKMVSNDTLATTLKSYPENVNSPMVNARDDSGNVGYGQWLRVPNTTTWYFLSGSFNQGTGTTNTGFLANGWFNLGWDGQDKWYYFDSAGVMKIGWHQEGNKIYYLQADFSDNWYGKAMTGQQMIGGQIYNFDSNGALIQ